MHENALASLKPLARQNAVLEPVRPGQEMCKSRKSLFVNQLKFAIFFLRLFKGADSGECEDDGCLALPGRVLRFVLRDTIFITREKDIFVERPLLKSALTKSSIKITNWQQ